MSNLLKCCCGCTHDYVVFVPCENTHASREIRMPVTDKANLAGCGLTEGTIYYFDAPNCDTYCGYWKCVIGADNSDNYCGDHSGLTACPACESWDDLVDPPYELIRPSDWTTTYCDRFTETGDCCDDLCPVDCGFGDIIPDDCDTCYDPSNLGWSAWVTWRQTQKASCQLVGAGTGCTLNGATRTVDLTNVSIVNITPSISGTTFRLCIETKLTFIKNMTDDCQAYDEDDPLWNCSPTCFGDDPDPQQVIGYTWSNYRVDTVYIPCMNLPNINTSTCSTTGTAETLCGLFSMDNYFSFVGSASIFSHAIGWGGNAKIYSVRRNIAWGANVKGFCWGCDINGPTTQGEGHFTIHVSASLPNRPDPCV